MALTECPDCGQQVSTNAIACPKCGCPIANLDESNAAGAHLVTTQATSKKLKMHTLLGLMAMIIGVIALFVSPEIGMALFVIGFLWWLVAKIRIWWHHE